jgi:hypothetical protein
MIAARGKAGRPGDGRPTHAAALGGWLAFAAAPTFAVMALLTAASGADADMLCSAAQGASPFGGMVPMYVLMSAFHSAPWLRLISQGGTPAGECEG